MVHLVTRHGSRAPSTEVNRLCPSLIATREQIEQDFGVATGHVTAKGMDEMRIVGEWLRKEYIDRTGFLPADFYDAADLTAYSAVEEPGDNTRRHVDSMGVLQRGLYPGHAWSEYMNAIRGDTKCSCPATSCATSEPEIPMTHASLVKLLTEFCGQDLESIPPDGHKHPSIQYVIDTLNFMVIQGLPVPSFMTPELREEAQDVALEVMLNASAFMNCTMFPRLLQDEVAKTLSHSKSPLNPAKPFPKFYVDVSSRELFYVLSHSNYYDFHLQVPGLVKGIIPPGSTLIWELHEPEDTAETPYVVFYYLYVTDKGEMSEKNYIRVQNCAEECPAEAFLDIHRRFLAALTCDAGTEQAHAGMLVEEWMRRPVSRGEAFAFALLAGIAMLSMAMLSFIHKRRGAVVQRALLG